MQVTICPIHNKALVQEETLWPGRPSQDVQKGVLLFLEQRIFSPVSPTLLLSTKLFHVRTQNYALGR